MANGWGGTRIGAGRKPKDRVAQRKNGRRVRPELLKFPHEAGAQPAFSGKAAGEHEPVPMPADLSAAARLVWTAQAPLAVEMGTLIPATASAFADLCEAVARRDDYAKRIDADGPVQFDQRGAMRAHPLIVHLRGLMQRIETAQMRFMLAPMGKSIIKGHDEPADPFAQFEQLA